MSENHKAKAIFPEPEDLDKIKRLLGVLDDKLTNAKDGAIDGLSTALKDGSLTLFLGAGVSENVGLPGWSKLLLGMVLRNIVGLPEGAHIDFDKLKSDPICKDLMNYPPVILARALRAHYDTGADAEMQFRQNLREVLYADYDANCDKNKQKKKTNAGDRKSVRK